MKHTVRVVLALMLAFMLSLGAFAEETAETAAEAAVSASAVTVTVAEKEFVPAAENQKVYIVLQNDSKDSVHHSPGCLIS